MVQFVICTHSYLEVQIIFQTLKDLLNVNVLLTNLTATTQHQSQYILQCYCHFSQIIMNEIMLCFCNILST